MSSIDGHMKDIPIRVPFCGLGRVKKDIGGTRTRKGQRGMGGNIKGILGWGDCRVNKKARYRRRKGPHSTGGTSMRALQAGPDDAIVGSDTLLQIALRKHGKVRIGGCHRKGGRTVPEWRLQRFFDTFSTEVQQGGGRPFQGINGRERRSLVRSALLPRLCRLNTRSYRTAQNSGCRTDIKKGARGELKQIWRHAEMLTE